MARGVSAGRAPASRIAAVAFVSSLLLPWLPTALSAARHHAPIVGGEISYPVRPGDSLTSVSARLGVDASVIARANGLAADARLKTDQLLKIENRHIVPEQRTEGILINVPERMLFFFQNDSVRGFPVGLGRPDWQTPTGRFAIAGKEQDPVWDVPPSIQEEMRREGKVVRQRVLPGPENPLGQYWIALTGSACGIHGTNAPSSVYRFRTHGCIRLHPDDVARLFPLVPIGLPVEIVYRPVLLAEGEDGAIWLEVHPDVYRRRIDALATARELAAKTGLEGKIDWTRAVEVIRERAGVARRVDGASSAP